jgi:hypothetical protein
MNVPPLRVGTWNLNRQARCWDELPSLVDRERLQVVLVQEAVRPATIPDEWRIAPSTPEWTTLGRKPEFTTAVVCTDPELGFEPVPMSTLHEGLLHYTFGTSQPGTYTVAEVRPRTADPLLVVSTYGLFEGLEGDRSSHTTLHRVLSDLEILINSPRGQRLILGGDLNSGTQPFDRYLPAHELLWKRFEQLGFRNLIADFAPGPLAGCSCNLGDACRHVRTQKFRGDSTNAWGADYILSRSGLVARTCRALNDIPDDQWVSDHCPVVATFTIV